MVAAKALAATLLLSCSALVQAGEEEVQDGSNLNMAELARQGRVTRWWWNLHAPKVTTLNDVNFDDYIAAKDFTMVEFFLPTCKHCESFSHIYNRIATTVEQERQDVQFARVNCGKDQSVRPPTPEEMDQKINPGVYDRPKGDETKYDGELVCEWYNMKDLPAIIFFRPGYDNPKFVDVVELTHDDILEWVEKEVGVIREEQGKDIFYQGEGLPPVGSATQADVDNDAGEEPKFKSREDVLKFLNKDGGDEDDAGDGGDLAAENKKLRAENKKLKAALKSVHGLVKDL